MSSPPALHVEAVAGFCMKLARALHLYGTPTPRLERAIEQCASRYGVDCQVLATPTGIQAAFGKGSEQRSYLERVQPGQVNLAKLSETASIHEDAMAGRISIQEGLERLEQVAIEPTPWSAPVTVLSFALTASAASVFLGGGLREVAAASIVGFGIGLLAITLGGTRRVQGLFEFLAALSASALSMLLAGFWPGLVPHVPTLAGLIVLVPGLSLTIAMSELSRQHLVAGTARLMGAAVIFLLIGMGVVLGGELRGISGMTSEANAIPLPYWATFIALPIAACTFTVLFQARMRDCLPILLGGCLAIYGTQLGNEIFPPAAGISLGLGLGALLVGLLGNIRFRYFGQPSEVTDLPGILLIVPGSLGYQSLRHLLSRETLLGLDTAFAMTTTAVTLVIGLLLANFLLPPVRHYRDTESKGDA